MTVTTRPHLPQPVPRSAERSSVCHRSRHGEPSRGLSEVIRFTGFMTILAAMGVDAGARSVINR